MSDLYDEYPGKTVVWVRWNPDNYKPPPGHRKRKRSERLAALVLVLRERETRTLETKMVVVYLFYDASDCGTSPKNLSTNNHFFAFFALLPPPPVLRFLVGVGLSAAR